MNKWNSGEQAPKAGTYKVVDKNGKIKYTVEMQKDKRFPPTQSSEYHFEEA